MWVGRRRLRAARARLPLLVASILRRAAGFESDEVLGLRASGCGLTAMQTGKGRKGEAAATARDGDGRGEAWKTLHWLWALEGGREASDCARARAGQFLGARAGQVLACEFLP